MARYCCVEARTTCGKCGQPLPLNGPTRSALCNACHDETPLPASLWKSLLDDVEEDWAEVALGEGQSSTIFTGGGQFQRNWYKANPRCGKCKTPLPADDIPTGTDGTVHCPSCGTAMITHPAPAWLMQVMPTVVQVFGGVKDTDTPAVGAVAGADATAPQPILMTCPQCGGALKITTESARISACTFCKADVYLPDDIWKRLHPVKTVGEWFLRLAGEGKSKEPEDDTGDPSAADDSEPEHEHDPDIPEVAAAGGGRSMTGIVIGVIVVLGALSYGGFQLGGFSLNAPIQGPSGPAASGQLQASGPRLGNWTMAPTSCTSLAAFGTSGAELRGADAHSIRVMQDPALHVVAGPGVDGLMVDFAVCAVLQGSVVSAPSLSTGSQVVSGTVTIQCTEPGGNSISGTATFSSCP